MLVRACAVVAMWVAAGAAGIAAYYALVRPGVAFFDGAASVAALRLVLAASPVAVPFLVLLAILAVAVGLWSLERARPSDAALCAAFTWSMLAVLCAASVAMFFLAWEAMALSSAFLVAAHHERRGVRRATFTYAIVGQAGAVCILIALALLATGAGDTTFAAIARASPALPAATRAAVLALTLAGFGSKAGLVPLHFWLPRAHPVAPANASALLSGAMLKVALYGIVLVTFRLAAPVPAAWGVALALAGALSAVIGVLFALVEHDLKRLLAYHSVENVGIIAIGLGVAVTAQAAGLVALAALALTAALLHCVNHGLFKALLFLGAGTIAETQGSVDLEQLGGLARRLVWTAPAFLIGCAAIAGVPPLNGFVSEWLTFWSLIAGIGAAALDPAARVALLVAFAGLALTSGLAVACFVKVFGVAFLGRSRRTPESDWSRERLDPAASSLGFLALLCAGIGLVPALAVAPIGRISAALAGSPAVPAIPASLVPGLIALPFAGALAALALGARRGVRAVPTWTCGSAVTPAAQYTASAFSNPLRIVFAFALRPVVDAGIRRVAALSLRFARRSQAVQGGNVRIYVAYALGAIVVAVAVAVR